MKVMDIKTIQGLAKQSQGLDAQATDAVHSALIHGALSGDASAYDAMTILFRHLGKDTKKSLKWVIAKDGMLPVTKKDNSFVGQRFHKPKKKVWVAGIKDALAASFNALGKIDQEIITGAFLTDTLKIRDLEANELLSILSTDNPISDNTNLSWIIECVKDRALDDGWIVEEVVIEETPQAKALRTLYAKLPKTANADLERGIQGQLNNLLSAIKKQASIQGVKL